MNESPTEIILSKTDKAYASEQAAVAAIKARNLDPETNVPVEISDGWAIGHFPERAGDDDAPPGETADTTPAGPTADPEYWVVKFQARTSPLQEAVVKLGLNGNVLFIERQKEVILPKAYLEIADHAASPTWGNVEGKNRQAITGETTAYAYHRLRPATRREFELMLKEGTVRTKRHMDELQGVTV